MTPFKLIPVSLLPLGRDIISIDEARAMGTANAITIPNGPATRAK